MNRGAKPTPFIAPSRKADQTADSTSTGVAEMAAKAQETLSAQASSHGRCARRSSRFPTSSRICRSSVAATAEPRESRI